MLTLALRLFHTHTHRHRHTHTHISAWNILLLPLSLDQKTNYSIEPFVTIKITMDSFQAPAKIAVHEAALIIVLATASLFCAGFKRFPGFIFQTPLTSHSPRIFYFSSHYIVINLKVCVLELNCFCILNHRTQARPFQVAFYSSLSYPCIGEIHNTPFGI